MKRFFWHSLWAVLFGPLVLGLKSAVKLAGWMCRLCKEVQIECLEIAEEDKMPPKGIKEFITNVYEAYSCTHLNSSPNGEESSSRKWRNSAEC